MVQIMKGMEAFMSENIAHRDIKHNNFVLHFPSAAAVDIRQFDFLGSEPWFVKIVDLGFAKEIEEDQTTATVCGTPGFTAPEIFLGKPYNGQCDVWSLGIFYFYLLTLKLPYEAPTPQAILKKQQNGAWIVPEHAAISCEGLEFLNDCLQFDPIKRIRLGLLISHSYLRCELP